MPRGLSTVAAFVVLLGACTGADDSQTPADAATADAVPTDAGPSWTLAVLPDTQMYAAYAPATFLIQTEWLATHAAALDLRYVLHVGDVVNDAADPEEWARARAAMDTLSGVVPFALVPGNHDYLVDQERSSPLSIYFPVAEFSAMPGAGGLFDPASLDNSYHLFSAAGEDWLVLALEWGPRQAVLDWAASVLDAYPERRVIVLTHAFLYIDDSRYDWASRGASQLWNPHSYPAARWPEVHDGQEIWDTLIDGRTNIELVLCGHAAQDGTGRLTAVTAAGGTVHQVLANYQDWADGGGGYLRLMHVYPDRFEVITYSPLVDDTLDDPEQHFVLPRPPR
jgi:hypothetical protein